MPQGVDRRKRRLLIGAASLVGGAAAIGASVPFVDSMWPSEAAKAAAAPVEADIGALAPGEMQIVAWRGQPVWILRRTAQMLEDIRRDDPLASDPHSDVPQQPGYAKNEFRSVNPEIAILVGVCTHLGCAPQLRLADDNAEMGVGWNGGFYCPCHGSKFDFAGRVLKGSPAPTNLVVPPYRFASSGKVIIGDETKPA
jgi:ubiquinol-cytochrome c reductase iron-sulfur subunit